MSAAELRRLIDGFRASQVIHAAAALGLADLLGDESRTSEELAASTGADPRTLYRLLRTLAALGIFREEAGQRFTLTELGRPLRTNAHDSVAGWAVLIGRSYYRDAWSHLVESVRAGENAFRLAYGMSVWDYRAQHPEEGAIFDAAMASSSRLVIDSLLAAYDFGRFETIVDVGGGNGALLAALPDGGDAYLLKWIIHDWEDEESTAILRTIRRTGGTVLVIERLLGPPNEDPVAKLSDINMLVGPGGRERTLEEFAALFEAAGYRLAGSTSTASSMHVLEGVTGY